MSAAAQPEQLPLIEEPDLWRLIDVAELRRERERLRKRTRAAETLRAYEGDWRHFSEWCASAGRQALPTSEETVELYVTHFGAKHKVSTLQRRLSAISQQHKAQGYGSPVGEGSRLLLESISREKGTRPKQKAALTVEQLREISGELDPMTPQGGRDRAILVLGFATGLRRSDLAALRLEDLQFVKQGLIVQVRKSKTDQHSMGRSIGIFRGKRAATCPVRTLKAWLRHRGKEPGPLFTRTDRAAGDQPEGITGETVHDVVKRCVELIGLDPAEYGGHSLRAGMITAAHDSGASELAIMRRSGHKSVQVLQRYLRSRNLFARDVLAKVL